MLKFVLYTELVMKPTGKIKKSDFFFKGCLNYEYYKWFILDPNNFGLIKSRFVFLVKCYFCGYGLTIMLGFFLITVFLTLTLREK
jgi:hypothetical protein